MAFKEYGVSHAAILQDKRNKRVPLYEINKKGEKITLQRHTRPEDKVFVFDEIVLGAERVENRLIITIGAVQKKIRPEMAWIVDHAPLRVRVEDDIPLVTYLVSGEEISEQLCRLDHEARPRVAWIELMDSAAQIIPLSSWGKTEMPG